MATRVIICDLSEVLIHGVYGVEHVVAHELGIAIYESEIEALR